MMSRPFRPGWFTVPRKILDNPHPRPVREMTDAERQAVLAEVTDLQAAIQSLPDCSPTMLGIWAELRRNDDGSELPDGMECHPPSDEFAAYDMDLAEVYDAVWDLKEATEQALVNLLACLKPWKPR